MYDKHAVVGLGGAVAILALVVMGPACRREPPLPAQPFAAIWAVDDGDDLERESNAPPKKSRLWDGRTVRLFAARNEIIAFQLIVRAGRPGIAGLVAALPALHGADGKSAITYRKPAADPTDYRGQAIQIFSVGYMDVRQPTEADFIYTPDGDDAPADPTGSKAVQLIPENARAGRGGFPLTVRPGELQALWFEIDTGRDRPAGIYRGQITLTAAGARTEIPVELELFDFTLPDENALSAMVYYESSQPELFQGKNLDAAYHRFAHRQRIELVDAYDEARLLAALGRFAGQDFAAAAGYEGPGRDVGNRIVPASFYGPGEGWQEKASAWRRADAWMELIAAKVPRAITFLYMPDEPGAEQFPEIRKLGEMLRANPGPGGKLPTLVTHAYAPGLAGGIDIWCTIARHFDEKKAAEERAAGRQYWLYNGGRPHGPALVIDAPASEARVVGWLAFKGAVPVYFYWHAVHWRHNHQKKVGDRNQNVWKNPITFDSRRPDSKGEFANGDGVLIYPGTDVLHPDEDRGIPGPIGTVQLANLRRGLQDHLYLTLARQRGHGALVDRLVQEIVPRVFRDAKGKVSFPEESGPFEEARWQLAQALAGASSARN